MSELVNHVPVENGSNRNFGLTIGTVFLLIGLYPLFQGEMIRYWSLIIGIVLILLGLLAPAVLSTPNRLWFKFGLLLGAVVAPVVMSLIFFLVVTPTGLILRMFGKDILNQKPDPNAKSYWIIRKDSVGPMKNQF